LKTSADIPDSVNRDRLSRIEERLSRIEKQLDILPPEVSQASPEKISTSNEISDNSQSLEFHIGEFWLAKSGIIILAIGIAFLLTFPYRDLPAILPALFGYFLVLIIISMAYLWRNSFQHISRYLLGGALLLIYFSTLRLYFFSDYQTITDLNFELTLLSIVVIINLAVSIYKKSIFLTALSLSLGYLTAIISDANYLIFFFISMCSIIAVYLKIKYDWNNLYIFSLVMSYLTHLLWFLNNPLIGNRMEFVNEPIANLAFLLIYLSAFAIGNLFRNKMIPENTSIIIGTFLNCAGGLGISYLILITMFQSLIYAFSLTASVLLLLFSALFWIREKSQVSTFFYAIAGYTTLSIAIISKFDNPDFFILLSWQSIVVISTAIWYRSKFIILANFVIYLMIFSAYLILATDVNITSLSFGIVALVSARIMNWQKSRLMLKTELMRNAYLVGAFVMFPYTFYKVVAGQYIIISWLAVALVYYILSRLLNNKKYRWLALFTLLLTVGYILIIGIVQLEPAYRILSFIVLGIVLIITSLMYSRIKSKSTLNSENPETLNKSK
jgi:hypothetical protein